MIDGEIYTRSTYPKTIFIYRHPGILPCKAITHYAAVSTQGDVFIRGFDGGVGRINRGETTTATEQEIRFLLKKLKQYGFVYNKDNKKIIRINTGELL